MVADIIHIGSHRVQQAGEEEDQREVEIDGRTRWIRLRSQQSSSSVAMRTDRGTAYQRMFETASMGWLAAP